MLKMKKMQKFLKQLQVKRVMWYSIK